MANGDTKFSHFCIMAHYSYPISYLLTIALVFSVQIEARESKFFTKAVIHYNTNTTTNNATTTVEPLSPSPSPSHSTSPSEAPAPTESESGYGLYGQSVAEFANTFDNNEGEIPAEEFKELSNKEYSSNNNNNNYNNGFPTNYNEHAYVTVPQESSDTKFMENGNTPQFYEPKFNEQFPQENLYKENNNKGYPNNYNNGFPTNYNEHAYVTVPQESSDTKYMENGNTPNFYEPKFNEQFPQENLYKENNNKGYPNNNYNEKFPDENRYKENNNGYTTSNYYANEREPQGMSDTRFLENGKYYYNPKKEINYGGVEERHGENNERYYGNSFGERSKYEFDSMEEYDRQQGYTETDPGAYLP